MVTVLRPLTSLQFQIHHDGMRSIFVLLFFLSMPQVLTLSASAKEGHASHESESKTTPAADAKPTVKSVAAKPTQSKIQVKVLQASGAIFDSSSGSKVENWNSRSRVSDRISLDLKPGAQTKIQLNPQMILTAYGNTEFEIPLISWETRQFKQIKLTKGSIRLEVKSVPFEFNLTTPFYDLNVPAGIWVFTIDPERALADILALKGQLEVTTLNSEDKVRLKAGERVSFRGVLEEGEIAYDLLLEGRKIPKGKWTAVEKLTAEDNFKFSIESEMKKHQQEEMARAQTVRDRLKKQAGDVCTKPYGDLRECLWKKEKNQCIRVRCTADGTWKDPQIVDSSACDKAAGWTPNPKKCDY